MRVHWWTNKHGSGSSGRRGQCKQLRQRYKTINNQQQQQQQLKKLGVIIFYLDKFNHNRSLHMPRAQGQTASQSKINNQQANNLQQRGWQKCGGGHRQATATRQWQQAMAVAAATTVAAKAKVEGNG
jgi:hypothetical protein